MTKTTIQTTIDFKDSRVLPSIRVPRAVKRAVKINTAEDEISMAEAVRGFLSAYAVRDPDAQKIIERIKESKSKG